MTLLFGQLVIGAPGAGKSTYCNAMIQMLKAIERPALYVNLDPANDLVPCQCDIDIRELITVEEVMEKLRLGPNGALRYCMQVLMKNIEWLKKKLENRKEYLIIDMPGQLELYNSDFSIRNIVSTLGKYDLRLCAVHLSDCMHCSDAGKFVAVVLSTLSVMINLEIPQLNVLSKIDLLPESLPFDLDFFEEVPNLRYLVERLDDHPALRKYKDMCDKLSMVVEDYNLVSFLPLDVMDKEKLLKALQFADKANGFWFLDKKDVRGLVIK
ncbi:unnamed protein product [Bursaphelenchus xylophilus]|uniref:GPN-loop GTPase 2 n=1 Tax=Bursaphelenchus xylophilus TaxID=6326 RepID=A0A1I7S7D2_BURXY|nr:unnamed protein product [Bursaphelenchus xylophilus]CAG9084943.1 unnamed protein product [Bursaphelenchus xylophilus]